MITTRDRAQELGKRLSLESMERAYRAGMNLSRWLEEQDPSAEYTDGLDAFERQLAVAGITTTTNRERGFYADRFEKFEEAGEAGRALQIEWMARQYRKVAGMTRSMFSSDGSAVGTIMRPYVDAAQARYAQMSPAIPLAELIALHTQIDSNVYRALYLNDDEKEYRMVRVGEAAEIPGATLTEGERPIDLYKYGRKLKISYEALRRVPIDTVAFYIARMAIQAEVDKVKTVLDVIVNGDGNAGTAAQVIKLSDVDGNATLGVLTLKGWLAFKMKFRNPYALTHELAREDAVLQQLLLTTGSANVPVLTLAGAAHFGGFTPINPALGDNVRYGITDDAPADKVIGIDSRYAIEQVSEIGGTVQESMRWITNQTQDLVFTEVEGYAVIDSKAAKILDLAS
jgi:hypothetical protein